MSRVVATVVGVYHFQIYCHIGEVEQNKMIIENRSHDTLTCGWVRFIIENLSSSIILEKKAAV